MIDVVHEGKFIKVVKPAVWFVQDVDGVALLKKIELCGRTAYKSEHLLQDESYKGFVKKMIELGHESVVEHASVSFKVVCDRGVSHEIVRHRIASYTQESTRYCNYGTDKFGNKIWVVKPWFLSGERYERWLTMMEQAGENYLSLIDEGWKPEEARAVLPNSLKTEIAITMNFRELRHFLKLRCDKHAHPQIREVACLCLDLLHQHIPIVFDDIYQLYKDDVLLFKRLV